MLKWSNKIENKSDEQLHIMRAAIEANNQHSYDKMKKLT